MKTLKKRKNPTEAAPLENHHRAIIEEAYEEVNIKSFSQNFRALIHHYKKNESLKVPRK